MENRLKANGWTIGSAENIKASQTDSGNNKLSQRFLITPSFSDKKKVFDKLSYDLLLCVELWPQEPRIKAQIQQLTW